MGDPSTPDASSAAIIYPRWSRHLDPMLRRCSNCQGRGDVGSWHAPIKCGVCDDGYVPVDSPFAMDTSTRWCGVDMTGRDSDAA